MSSPILVSIVDDHVLLHWFAVLTPIAISLVIAGFAFNQWRIARNAHRLNLYQRRYALFETVLRFARDYFTEDFIKEEYQRRAEIGMVIRESRFLFDPLDGITKIIEDIQVLADSNVLVQKRDDAIYMELNRLEERLSKYLNFHGVQ